MKKLMVVAAVVAMAIGAQAEETYSSYQFTLSVGGLSAGLDLSRAKFCLVDPTMGGDSGQIIAYGAGDMFGDPQTTSASGDAYYSTEARLREKLFENSGQVNIHGNNYDIVSHKIYDGGSAIGVVYDAPSKDAAQSKIAEFEIWVDSTDAAIAQRMGDFGYGAGKTDLIAYLEVGDEFFGQYEVFYTKTGGTWDFSAGTPSTIPEPTSGFLLLLGMAGLVLKRKRA